MFGIGFQEMAFLAVIALLVFGPKRLPELARTLGRGMAEFRRASADLRGALSLDSDAPAPQPRPRRREDEADPRADRDYRPAPAQSVGGPDTSAAAAAEAAVLAELADEANDEVHRDAKPAEAASNRAAGASDPAAGSSDSAAGASDSAAGAPDPAAGSIGGAETDGVEPSGAETDPSRSGRSD